MKFSDAHKQIAEEMDVSDKYIYRFLSGDETDVFEKFRVLYAAGLLSQSVLSVRPRVAELFKQGRIYPTGETRKNASGRPAKVWAAKV